jgi:hypothetical protein
MPECNPCCSNPCCCNGYCCIVRAVSELAAYLRRAGIAVMLADLVRTSFMDSSALHLIGALRLRTSEQGGALVVVVATCGVRRLLGVTPPPRDVPAALARSRRGAAITNRRFSPHIGQTVAA